MLSGPCSSDMALSFSAISESASSQLTRTNFPWPFAPTLFCGLEQTVWRVFTLQVLRYFSAQESLCNWMLRVPAQPAPFYTIEINEKGTSVRTIERTHRMPNFTGLQNIARSRCHYTILAKTVIYGSRVCSTVFWPANSIRRGSIARCRLLSSWRALVRPVPAKFPEVCRPEEVWREFPAVW